MVNPCSLKDNNDIALLTNYICTFVKKVYETEWVWFISPWYILLRATSTRAPGFRWREDISGGHGCVVLPQCKRSLQPVWTGHTGFKHQIFVPSLWYPKLNKTAISHDTTLNRRIGWTATLSPWHMDTSNANNYQKRWLFISYIPNYKSLIRLPFVHKNSIIVKIHQIGWDWRNMHESWHIWISLLLANYKSIFLFCWQLAMFITFLGSYPCCPIKWHCSK